MRDLDSLRKSADVNLSLAKTERENAKNLKFLGKDELVRAKAREKLMESDLKVAKRREDMAEHTKKLVEKKIKIKESGLYNFSEDALKRQKDYVKFLVNISKSQKEIAEINEKIAIIEREIAQAKINQADLRNKLADIREKLGKKQLDFIKTVNKGESEEKQSTAESEYLKIEKRLIETKKEHLGREQKIRKKQVKLADIKAELSKKISQQSKIVPISRPAEIDH